MTQAQKTAKAKFKQAIAYRQKTGVTLKEAFAHIYGKKKVVKKAVKKAAPKKKAIKKVAKKRIAGPKDSKLIKKELAKKGLKMPHGYTTVKRKRKISGVKRKPTETQVLKTMQKAVSTQKKHMIGSVDKLLQDYKKIIQDIESSQKIINILKESLKYAKRDKVHPSAIANWKIGIKKYTKLLSEYKTHAKEIKKLI